jgi:hypothetical protein
MPGSAPPSAAADGHAAGGTPLPPEVGQKQDFMQTLWALCDKNGLDRKGQAALMLALSALGALVFAMLLLPRYTETVTDLAQNKVTKDHEWFWWHGSIMGAFVLFASIVEVALIMVAFAKMHVFLRYGVFAGLAWGLFTTVFFFFYFVYMGAIAGGDAGSVRVEYGVGLGTYLALLSAVGILGSFAVLAIPEIMKLVKKQPAAA